ncbi:XRE family transcriptional regulator [Parashewanella curva]|uniref:XRE family transcriptional regulator n=1 Tax=Parashewanella curva TaxID=2338552 RepID=A0A3L8Q264_9GAMM|nr:helix-turn-helix transcriptional regulator [Parashewanella curva]RLV60402.1 XRE family transcriptional regulator [Parashewanella curva]
MSLTFGERLEYALMQLHVSQAELGRRSGVSQQSINYIVQKKLDKSKFAFQLADCLDVNPSWLLHGVGRFESCFAIDIPIINSFVDVQKFIRDGQLLDHKKYIIIEKDIGKLSFAFQLQLDELIICGEQNTFGAKQFLKIEPLKIEVLDKSDVNTFPIYEIRRRCVEY